LIDQVFASPPEGVNKNGDYFITLDEILSQKCEDGAYVLSKLLEGWKT
jgi:hypothetical protein